MNRYREHMILDRKDMVALIARGKSDIINLPTYVK